MSTPPRESSPTLPSPTTPLGVAQTVRSLVERASLREDPTDTTPLTAALGATQPALTRLASSSTQAASSSKHIPAVPREPPAEAPVAPEPSQGAAHPNLQRPTFSTPHSGRVRATTLPIGGARPTRSRPPPPEAVPLQNAGSAGRVYRLPTGPYPNSETEWPFHDRELFRERTVGQRLEPTILTANEELARATKKAMWSSWAENVALALQVLFGTLTTAVGAALGGKNSVVGIALLGGASTLVASYLARTKGSNEPQFSLLRSQALKHFLREIESFVLDHGHEVGSKWDHQIVGFRLGLERILGSHHGSVRVNPDGSATNPGQEDGAEDGEFSVGQSGNEKFPLGATNDRPEVMPV
ncbi:hypothetical protein BC826DRAFT_1050814 [Russula brevipes]|nr:hypothetical protein BC826DRAFT_1050814 [Russula brevipes]